ncbi:MAG: 1-hydroxycarotenoid 3,4-desaturase CrtD [Flavobacteriaceae bacterium]
MKKAIVVGAGIGGLATSIRLKLKGYETEVFEANSYPGGKLSAFERNGYRFDAGPSLFTMPHFVTELFDLAGEKSEIFFQYKKKEIACNYFWSDQTRFSAYSDLQDFLKEVECVFGEPRPRVEQYLRKAKKKYDLTASLFLEHSLHKLQTYLSTETLKALIQLPTFELQKTLHQANQDAFESPHLIQLFDRYATYNGSDPYQTSGMMTLIQHLESFFGTFVPKGGMIRITQSLYELALRLGIQFRFEEPVKEILIENQKAVGIRTDRSRHRADIVVSNMDVFPTYKKLLSGEKAPGKLLKQERSSSAVIFYWGIQKEFKQLELHNIFFSDNYKKEFEAIFKEKSLSDDPTIYITIPTTDVPDDAPTASDKWLVMNNTPANHGQDWDVQLDRLRTIVIDKLSRELKTPIEPLIKVEEVLTPPLIEEKTQSYMGALYGASSNNTMAAFLRHPNFSNRIKNLYFCGGSVHPGGGIPLCLLSAKIVSDLIPKVE